MSLTIGGKNFIRVQGPPLAVLGPTMDAIDRPGLDGQGYRLQGKRPDPQAYRSVSDFSTASLAVTEITAYRALQGTLVTVVDEQGNTTNSVLVEKVATVRLHKVLNPVGGQGASYVWILECQWLLRTTA